MNLFFKKMQKNSVSSNYMDLIFVHAGDKPYTVDDKGIVTVDVTNKGFYNKIAQRFWNKPSVSHIELDEYGSCVWNSLDGQNTVNEVLEIMYDKYPDEKERMLDRLITFMNILQNNKYIIIKN